MNRIWQISLKYASFLQPKHMQLLLALMGAVLITINSPDSGGSQGS